MSEIIESSSSVEPVVNVEPQATEVDTNEQATEVVSSSENVEVTNPQEQQTKPVQSAEDNAKYAAIRREAEAKATEKARDAVIAEMFGESHGIRTYAEYQAALKAEQEARELERLANQNIPEEIAKEILESRKEREERKARETEQAKAEKQRVEFKEFIDNFPDVKPSEIPEEVWKANEAGIPLRYAYAEYALKQSRIEATKQKANAENAQTSMGKVGTEAASEDGFISKETFELKRNDRQWIIKNLSKIAVSRSKW
jgi:hypothetical protein